MSLRIRTDDGRVVDLPESYLEHVQYGYAQTGHAAQGATVDRTYLLASPARGGREWGYVAGSRHRVDLRVYALHHDADLAREELQRTWLRSQAKTLAVDRLDPSSLDQDADADRREQPQRADHGRDDEDRSRAEEHAVPADRESTRAERQRAAERRRDDEQAREDAPPPDSDLPDDIAAWLEQERAEMEADLALLDDELDHEQVDDEPPHLDEPQRSIDDDDDDLGF
jgi:hypothetical protein